MRKKCSYKRKFNKQGESYIEFDNVSSLIIKFDKITKMWYIMFKMYRKSWLSILRHFSFYIWAYVRNINGSALFFEDESKAIKYVVDNYIRAFGNEFLESDYKYYNRIKDIPVDCLDEDDLFFMKSYKYIKPSEKLVYIEEIEKRKHYEK